MPSGSLTVSPIAFSLVPQVFGTNPDFLFVGPRMFKFAPQKFVSTSELELDVGIEDLVNIKLERLERSYAIADGQGRPDFAFQRWWGRMADTIERAIQSLAKSGINTNQVLARLLAAEEAARQANATAEAAQKQAQVQSALQRVRDSGVDANPLSATTTGTASTISIAAHQRVYLDPAENLPVNAGSIPGLTPNTVYFVSYLDQAMAGGAVTYEATTDEAAATASEADPYRHKVGSVQTPAASGGSSSGTGWRPPWQMEQSYL